MKLAFVAGCALLLATAEAWATVYTLTLPPDPGINFVTGTITTDGATGTLLAADITSWNINQSADTVHFQANLNPANSVVTLTGSALTATATQLFFNFGGSTNSLLEFAPSNFFTGGGGISLQMCDSAGTCLDQNLTQSHSRLMMAFIAPGCCSTSSGVNESVALQIGAASTTPSVPEPSTWALMLVGFAGLGFAFRRSRRKVSCA
jgi:PEP-CTERM motif